MKKREDRFDRKLTELYEIEKMLKEEGKADGECRYKVFVAAQLLYLALSFHDIALMLVVLLTFVVIKFFAGSL